MDEAAQLLAAPNFAQFGTVNADGSPHVDTAWYVYQDGALVIATTLATKKARNISNNTNGYVVVTNRDNAYEQAQLKVVLSKIEPDENLEVCDAIAQRYTGKPFPQRHYKGRVAIYLEVVSCKYHVARV